MAQIATLPATPALRREQIKLQVDLINPLIHVKGQAAPETKLHAERARLLIEQAEKQGEAPEDPLVLFSVLYAIWAVNFVAFNGDVCRELATHFLTLAQKNGGTVPLVVGHRLMGVSLLWTGHVEDGKAHFDRALALYDPAEHRLLGPRFGQDLRVIIFMYRSWANWILGYPDVALVDTEQGLKDARGIGRAVELMVVLSMSSLTQILCGNYARAEAQCNELIPLAAEKGAAIWKAWGTLNRGGIFALTGKLSDAAQTITTGIDAWRSTGGTAYTPTWLSYLAKANADLYRFEEASGAIAEALKTIGITGERWCEAEVNRTAGEIALVSPKPNVAKAEAYFQRALAVARQQQAKSWELRASMSLARLWRDQGKPSKLVNCSLPCTAGSLRGSTRAI